MTRSNHHWAPSIARIFSAALWGLAAAPVALYAAMITQAVRLRMYLGHWHRSGMASDVRQLPGWLVSETPGAIVAITILISAIALGAVAGRRWPIARRVGLAFLLVAVVWLLTIVILRQDPGGIADWYLD